MRAICRLSIMDRVSYDEILEKCSTSRYSELCLGHMRQALAGSDEE